MHHDFGMFSKAGNRKVASLVKKALKRKYSLSTVLSEKELYIFLTQEMNKIAKSGHGEVWDTDVRSSIISDIEKATSRELTVYF